jgi:3-oxoadipate enol-lactonase
MWKTRAPDYYVSGSSDTTVYLLHGTYGGKEYWQPLTKRLVHDGYRVVAWDAPGYGVSPIDPEFSIVNAADACTRLIAMTGTKKNVIFGHSMGGQIAMRVMQKIPGLIDAFIISASIGYLANQTESQKENFYKLRDNDATDPEEIYRKNFEIVSAMMGPRSSGPDVELVKCVGAATPGHAVKAALHAVRATTEQEVINILASIRVPSLFIAGEVDTVGHAASVKRNADRVAGSQYEVLAGCGHYPWAESPEKFWKILQAFLAQVK